VDDSSRAWRLAEARVKGVTMPGGNRIPIEQWPTRNLIGVGLAIAFIAGFGLVVLLRVAWTAGNQGNTVVIVGALAVAGFLGVWGAVSVQFGRILFRRRRSGRIREGTSSREKSAQAEAKDESESEKP
jgi:hypothetical protein